MALLRRHSVVNNQREPEPMFCYNRHACFVKLVAEVAVTVVSPPYAARRCALRE